MSTRCSLLDLIEAERELYAHEESEKQESWELRYGAFDGTWTARYMHLGVEVTETYYGKRVG